MGGEAIEYENREVSRAWVETDVQCLKLEFVRQVMGTMNGIKQGSDTTRFAFQIDQAGSYVKNGFEEERQQPMTVDGRY